MTHRYVLRGREAVPEPDLETWAKAFETEERIVARDDVAGASVSTVFLGLDHNFGSGPPLLFETMIFGGPHDQWQCRYSTLDEAECGHVRVVGALRRGDTP